MTDEGAQVRRHGGGKASAIFVELDTRDVAAIPLLVARLRQRAPFSLQGNFARATIDGLSSREAAAAFVPSELVSAP